MILVIFFFVIFVLMLCEDSSIKEDVNSASKIKWSKKDSKDYYDSYLK